MFDAFNSKKNRCWLLEKYVLLFVVLFFTSTCSAYTLSDVNDFYIKGHGLSDTLNSFEQKNYRDHFDEINNLQNELSVTDHQWSLHPAVTLNSVGLPLSSFFVNARVQLPDRIETYGNGVFKSLRIIPLSQKGIVLRVTQRKNPFFLVAFLRWGSVTRLSSGSVFEPVDMTKAGSSSGRTWVTFVYLCFQGDDHGTKTTRCASTPPDLDADVNHAKWQGGHPASRVALSEWSVTDPGLKSVLSSSDFFSTRAAEASVSKRKSISKPTAKAGPKKFIYAQRPSLGVLELAALKLMDFDAVILQLVAQDRPAGVTPFVGSLRSAKQYQPLQIIGWLNLLESNNYIGRLSTSSSLGTFTPKVLAFGDFSFTQTRAVRFASGNFRFKKACMDDRDTVLTLADFYDALFTQLSKKIKENGMLSQFGGILIDYESVLAETCAPYSSTESNDLKIRQMQVRTENVDLLYGRIAQSFRAHFKGPIPIYLAGLDITPACSSTTFASNYVDAYHKFGFIPTPYTFKHFSKPEESGNTKCTLSCYNQVPGFLPLTVYLINNKGISCETRQNSQAAYNLVVQHPGLYRGITVYELNGIIQKCLSVCPDFIKGCSLVNSVASNIHS